MIPDPTTLYAKRVVAGTVVASRLVRQACQRHLTDIEHQSEKGLVWRPDLALEAIEFFSEVLVLPEDVDADEQHADALDETPPQPFNLQPFQEFIVGSLFGWYTVKGHRRIHQAYVETAKGSGKTPLGAGVMLYMLVADGERGAQVYAAAVTRDQAKLAFTDAERMVEASPYLSELLDSKVNNLAVLETGSYFRAISSEKRGLDGKRVHGCLIDELHEHPTHVVVNKMRKGIKGRRNALILEITNSGFDRTTVCWAHHDYSRKVLDGSVVDDQWFAFICGLDPCDACLREGKWFPDESCPDCDDWKTEGPHWLKPNPNLGQSLPWDYVRALVNTAKGMPSEVSDVLRFNFCVWTQGASRAIPMDSWAVCAEMPPPSELIGVPCYGGLDMGESDDFSAWVLIWVLADGRVAVKVRFWVPDVALERFPNRQYPAWERAGILSVTEGDTTDYETVQSEILEDCQRYGVLSMAFDSRNALAVAQWLEKRGVVTVNTPQGFPLNEAIKRTIELVVDGDLCHGKNAILTWMASNVVTIQNLVGQRRIAKERSPEKIDGIAALVMAVDQGLIRNQQAASIYESQGVMVM